MKILLAIISFGLLYQTVDTKLIHTRVNKNISLDLPATMAPLTEIEIRQKYRTATRPIASYASMDNRSDLGINVIATHWTINEIDMMKRFYRSSLLNLYDSVSFIKEEIQQINNRPFLIFEFISVSNPDPEAAIKKPAAINYTYLQYTVVNGKLVVFTFRAPASQRERWQNITARVMQSVKIKKTL